MLRASYMAILTAIPTIGCSYLPLVTTTIHLPRYTATIPRPACSSHIRDLRISGVGQLPNAPLSIAAPTWMSLWKDVVFITGCTPVALGHEDNSFTFQGEYDMYNDTHNDGNVAFSTALGEFTGDMYLDIAGVWYDRVSILYRRCVRQLPP